MFSEKMTSTLLKYNGILIVLCIGITLAGAKVKKNIDLYYDPISPPCRSVLLTLEALDLELNFKPVDLLKGGTKTTEFREINPLHTIPVIQDGKFILSESYAIIVYLVRKYGKENHQQLAPKDPELEAVVNQRLHFDNGTLYPRFKLQYNGWTFNRIEMTDDREDLIYEALQYLEKVLEKSTWVAGDTITVADFALVASISTFVANKVKMEKYKKINEWLKNCETKMDGYEVNAKGIKGVEEMLIEMDKKFAPLDKARAEAKAKAKAEAEAAEGEASKSE